MDAKQPTDPSRIRVAVHIPAQTAPLVRLSSGAPFPQRFSATAQAPGGPIVGMTIEVENDRLVVTYLSLVRYRHGPTITSSLLKGFQLDSIRERVISDVASMVANDLSAARLPGGSHAASTLALRPIAVEESIAIGAIPADSQYGRPVSDTDLRRVAEICRNNDYNWRKQVARDLNVSERTASRWIATARKRGYLEEETGEDADPET